MNGKTIWLTGLAVALLGLGDVRGQGPYYPGGAEKVAPPVGLPPVAPPLVPVDPNLPQPAANRSGLSRWIVGERWPGCCGPIGCNGPIGSEVYLRSGLSIPLGGGLSDALETGWAIEGGGRVLFFNRAVDAAWTVDLGMTNINQNSSGDNGPFTLRDVPLQTVDITGRQTTVNVPTIDVNVAGANRTYVNASLGREYWLLGTADSSHHDINWRVGADLGGRVGTMKLDLEELKHRTDVIGAAFIAVHSDVEVPCGTAIFFGGVRAEYGYTWSNILQSQNDSDLQDVNLMFTIGARF